MDVKKDNYSIEHHHNSRRFKCPCGELHEWARYDGPQSNLSNPKVKYYEFLCGCGRTHWKLALNFRGEG